MSLGRLPSKKLALLECPASAPCFLRESFSNKWQHGQNGQLRTYLTCRASSMAIFFFRAHPDSWCAGSSWGSSVRPSPQGYVFMIIKNTATNHAHINCSCSKMNRTSNLSPNLMILSQIFGNSKAPFSPPVPKHMCLCLSAENLLCIWWSARKLHAMVNTLVFKMPQDSKRNSTELNGNYSK